MIKLPGIRNNLLEAHLSLTTCTKFAQNFTLFDFHAQKLEKFSPMVVTNLTWVSQHAQNLPRIFSCPTSIAPTPPPPAGSAAESPQVSTRKFLALQLGQTTACWDLQEKLWGRPWLKMMILPLKFALGGGNILLLRIKSANFMCFYTTIRYGSFLVWVSKDLLYCLSTRATNPNNFLPFHNDLNQIDQILIICSKRYNADCRVSKLIIFISCSP